MARAESNDLPWTFIQPRFSKPVPYLSAIPAYLAHDRAFEAHRLSPTHRFQVGSCTLQVYRAFKTNTFIFIELTFCPLSTWKTVSTEPLGNQVPMAEIIWLLIAHQTDIAFSAIKIVCNPRQV